MGHATAEAVVRAGLQLVPFSFTGASEAVAVGNVGVSGIPVELVHPDERQSAMESVKAQYPGLVLIDFTLPSVVNGEHWREFHDMTENLVLQHAQQRALAACL